jgi:hypothetical protein
VTGTIPLVHESVNILDAIYVSVYKKFPFHDKEIIVDKYPLARIYEQWKQQKEMRILQRSQRLQQSQQSQQTQSASEERGSDISQEPTDTIADKGFE